MDNTWIQILSRMREKLPEADYSVWLQSLKGSITIADSSVLLSITARNNFVANYIRTHYTEVFCSICAQIMGLSESNHPKIIIEIEKNHDTKQIKNISAKELAHSLASAPAVLATTNKQLPLPIHNKLPDFNFQYSFEEFVVGSSNRLAFAAAEIMLQEHAPTNMLFLSSQSGLGKTHLIQSVGHAVSMKSRQNNLRMAYLSAEQFTSQFVKAAQFRQMSEFKEHFRALDLLLLEDVHFLQGKEKTQEELLATIKALHARGGRVILTSSFSPKDIAGIDSHLISHFHSGFIASIEKPDMETRLNILNDKARKQSISLPENIAELMASRITTDIRILESCLKNLLLRSQLLNCPMTEDMALEIISHVAGQNPQLDLKSIVSLVCKSFNLTEKQLQSNSRRTELVLARNTVFFLLRKHTDMTLEQIGSGFNRRHSTVTKGISTLEKEMSRQSSAGRQITHAITQIERQCARV